MKSPCDLRAERGASALSRAGRALVVDCAMPSKQIAVIVGCGSKHDATGASPVMGEAVDKPAVAAALPPSSRYGLGGALALRFAKDYHVVLVARREAVANEVKELVVGDGGTATVVACDVAVDASVTAAFAAASALGPVELLVFNVGLPFPEGRTFFTLPKPAGVDPAYLNAAFDIGVTGLLRCVQQVIGPMLDAQKGTVLVSGATMALRGGKAFASMSPVMFARRSLAQSMFQEYAPHVATSSSTASSTRPTRTASAARWSCRRRPSWPRRTTSCTRSRRACGRRSCSSRPAARASGCACRAHMSARSS